MHIYICMTCIYTSSKTSVLISVPLFGFPWILPDSLLCSKDLFYKWCYQVFWVISSSCSDFLSLTPSSTIYIVPKGRILFFSCVLYIHNNFFIHSNIVWSVLLSGCLQILILSSINSNTINIVCTFFRFSDSMFGDRHKSISCLILW